MNHTLSIPLAVLALIAGCQPAVPETGDGNSTSAMALAVDEEARKDGAFLVGPPTCAPLRVVVFQDHSGQAARLKTPQLTADDLIPLTDRLLECGGELALGVLRFDSARPLLRVHVSEPQVSPNLEEPRGTPFQVRASRQRHADAAAAYDAALHEHAAIAGERIDAFLAQAGAMLINPPNECRTDIFGALARAALFLNERGNWAAPPRRVAVFITGGEDSVGTEARSLPADTELLHVAALPSGGALAEFDPMPFESFDAAVRFIVTNP